MHPSNRAGSWAIEPLNGTPWPNSYGPALSGGPARHLWTTPSLATGPSIFRYDTAHAQLPMPHDGPAVPRSAPAEMILPRSLRQRRHKCGRELAHQRSLVCWLTLRNVHRWRAAADPTDDNDTTSGATVPAKWRQKGNILPCNRPDHTRSRTRFAFADPEQVQLHEDGPRAFHTLPIPGTASYQPGLVIWVNFVTTRTAIHGLQPGVPSSVRILLRKSNEIECHTFFQPAAQNSP